MFEKVIQEITFKLIGFEPKFRHTIINNIYMRYFKLINPYIYYICNTKRDIKNDRLNMIFNHWKKWIKKIIVKI
jgi:hypothetical protein